MKKSVFSLLVFCLLPCAGYAQDFKILNANLEPYTATFVAQWANDTASIETFTIAGNYVYGRAIHLYPEPHLRHFTFRYHDDGSLRSMDMQYFELENTSVPLQSQSGLLPYRMTMDDRDGVIDFRSFDQQGEKQYVQLTHRMDFNGDWIPVFGQWQWLTNQLTEGRLGQDLKFLNATVGTYDLEVKQSAPDTVIFVSSISAPIKLILDADNKIKKVDAMGSPWNIIIIRSESPLNIEKYTNHFAQKPVIGRPSPSVEKTFSIHGLDMRVRYHSPRKRGREIFGNVVPYDVVWRTGAGSATTISFDHDLQFDDQLIPKGTYNLFTIPGKDRWQLIFNTEKNAWGSAYRSEYDFAKTEMQVTELPEIREEFSIEVAEKDRGGILMLHWDKTQATVAFKIAKDDTEMNNQDE